MIFVAKKEELPIIVKMALRIPELLKLKNLPEPDVEKVSSFMFEAWKTSPIFVYKENGKIIGFVATLIDSYWWSSENMIADYAWFVDPDHKEKGKIFNSLLGALVDLAKLNKLKITSNYLSTQRTETKEKLFERKGFEKVGFTMFFEV